MGILEHISHGLQSELNLLKLLIAVGLSYVKRIEV
jgi:hypothetical protein